MDHPPPAQAVLHQRGLTLVVAGGVAGQHRRPGKGFQHIVEHGHVEGFAVPVGGDGILGGTAEGEVLHLRSRGGGQRALHGLHDAVAPAVLLPRAAADDQRSAPLRVGGQEISLGLGQHDLVRGDQHGIAQQLLHRGVFPEEKHVVGGVGALGGLEHGLLAGGQHPPVPCVDLRVPLVVVVPYQGKGCCAVRPGNKLKLLRHGVDAAHLGQTAVVPVVVIEDAVPVHFRAEGAGAPAEEADVVRAVGDALHGPQGHLPGTGRGAFHTVDPAVGAGLLLHDAEVRADAAHLRQVPGPLAVIEAVGVEGAVQGEAEIGVGVVGVGIQALLGHAVVVDVSEHAVGGNEHAPVHMAAEDLRLHAAEGIHAVGDEAAVVQLLMGIVRAGGGGPGNVHLLPVGVRLVPEHRAPGLVQRVEGAVPVPQEQPEGLAVRLGIELVGLAVELIVDLPAHDSRMLAVAAGDFLHDAGAQLLIPGRIVVVVPPGAVAHERPVHEGVEALRVLLRQPGGRGGGGRAEDHLHALILAQGKEVVEEVIGEHALRGLKLAPGELAHADHPDARGLHPLQVVPPQAPVPMLGVIAYAQLQAGQGKCGCHGNIPPESVVQVAEDSLSQHPPGVNRPAAFFAFVPAKEKRPR